MVQVILILLVCALPLWAQNMPAGRISTLMGNGPFNVYCTFTAANGTALTTTDSTDTNGVKALVLAWQGGAYWGVNNNTATNAPALGAELLTNPGLEAPYAAGLANGWSKISTPTVAEETVIIHGGTSSQKYTGGGAGQGIYQQVAATVGLWYTITNWTYHPTGDAGTMYAFCNFASGNSSNELSKTITANNTWTEFVGSGLATSTGVRCYTSQGTATAVVGYLDDCSARQITFADTIKVVGYLSANASTSAALTLGASYLCPAGIIARCDSPTAPQNFILAWTDRSRVKVVKCVAGTYSFLLNPVTTYTSGRKLRVDCIGTSVRVYYDGAEITGSPVTVSDAAIVGNQYFGVFDTHAQGSVDTFEIYPR